MKNTCSSCDAKVQKEWKFCPFCGKDLSKNETSSNTDQQFFSSYPYVLAVQTYNELIDFYQENGKEIDKALIYIAMSIASLGDCWLDNSKINNLQINY